MQMTKMESISQFTVANYNTFTLNIVNIPASAFAMAESPTLPLVNLRVSSLLIFSYPAKYMACAGPAPTKTAETPRTGRDQPSCWTIVRKAPAIKIELNQNWFKIKYIRFCCLRAIWTRIGYRDVKKVLNHDRMYLLWTCIEFRDFPLCTSYGFWPHRQDTSWWTGTNMNVPTLSWMQLSFNQKVSWTNLSKNWRSVLILQAATYKQCSATPAMEPAIMWWMAGVSGGSDS